MKAFPIKGWNGHEETINEGMDLRDYFAAKYINGIVASPIFDVMSSFELLAENGYKLADAMMKAREK